jgi:hypothetical protein
MIFVIKGCLPWKLLNPFSSKDLHIGYPQWWFSLIGSFWWMKLYLYWSERLWLHMCSVLAKCLLATCTFELWKGTHDIFVVVINFLFSKWEAKCVTIGLFKVSDTNGATMVPKLQLLDRLSFIHKILAHVKDEGSNL